MEKDFLFNKSWFVTKEVVSGVLAIREPHHFEDALSFFISGTDQSVLIDTGMGLANIKDCLPEGNEPIVLLTHSHWDHIGGAREFNTVMISDESFEKERLEKGWEPYEMTGFNHDDFIIPTPRDFRPDFFRIPGMSGFSTVHDGDRFDTGGDNILAIHTPGHTPGSLCFFLEGAGFLFTGDTLYPGPEYLHLPESDHDQYCKSLYRLRREFYSRIKRIFPGHNAYSTSTALLLDHIAAIEGKLSCIDQKRGRDFFGEFVERKYAGFTLRRSAEADKKP